ncbi:hypothetical protein [Archangium sp.]|uniref:hypothetical protein n=1 Tax=Archangium sp. TaxID=1872627 RepID=UPI00389A19CB
MRQFPRRFLAIVAAAVALGTASASYAAFAQDTAASGSQPADSTRFINKKVQRTPKAVIVTFDDTQVDGVH